MTACRTGGHNEYELISSDSLRYFDIYDVDEVSEFDIADYIGKSTKLSDLVGDFYYLKLNTEGRFIGQIDKVIATDSVLILADRQVTNSVAGFDIHSGKLLFFVNDIGDGPEQFTSIYDVEIDEKNKRILIFDGDRRKIHEYSLTGSYIGNKNTTVYFSGFRFYNNIIVTEAIGLINVDVGGSADMINFLWLDSTHKVFGFADRISQKTYQNNYVGVDYMNRYKENISFMSPFDYSIHVYNSLNGQFTSPIRLKKSPILWDTKEIRSLTFNEFSKISSEGPLKYFSLGKHFISKEWAGLELRKLRSKSILIFSMIDGSSYAVVDEIVYDLPGLVLFGFPDTSNEDWLISYIGPQSISALIQPEGLARIKEENLYSSKLDLFYNGEIDPEDPVLLFYKLKKK